MVFLVYIDVPKPENFQREKQNRIKAYIMGQSNPHQPIFAEASPEIYTRPYPIIGPQYCVPYPVDIAIVRKFMSVTDGTFVVNDIADNLMFKVKEKLISLHKRRTVLDPYDNPIVTVTKKVHLLSSSSFPYFTKYIPIYCTFIRIYALETGE